MRHYFAKFLLLPTLGLLTATVAAAAGNSHKRVIDDNDTVVIHGNVNPNVRPENDRGPADPQLRYERMILILAPRSSAKDNVAGLLAQLHDPASPLYHQWLTPEQFGKRFGISDDDLADVTDWLARKGFTIDEVRAGRGWINFSGTVGQVERAFKTNIHDYEVDGRVYHANNKDPEI